MLMLTLLILSAVACSAQKAEPADREVLYQVSTINALLAGYYDGQISIEKLKEYGDTGIGTFADLDGEMIVLDGNVYRAKYDGTVEKVGDAESALLMGLNVKRTKFMAHVLCGLLAGIGGLLFVLHIFAYEKAAAARPSALLACRSSKTCSGQ